ncbi:MAG: hypothetical protein K1X94_33460 [Sandaracinaceae bacterium]|nr:hypothetical protein [Sandaracinaceae bacterium]
MPRAVGEGPRGAPSTDGSWAGGALELAVRGELLGLGHQAPDVSPGDVLSGALCIRWFPTDFVAAALVAHATGYPTSPHDLPEEHVTWDVAVRLSAFWGQTALFVGP